MDAKRTARSVTLAVTLAAASAAQAVPIADLHQNDTSGVPAAPYTIGTPVTVTGIVTVPDSVFNKFSTAVHVQDSTGGIYIFNSGSTYQVFDLGDSVSVSGEVAHFLGLTEIAILTDVTVHSSGNPVPDPLVLTCADVASTYNAGNDRDDNESRLVRINAVSITSGTWPTSPGSTTELTIADGSGSTTLVINQNSELNGSPAPPGVFDVTGVIQQQDSSSPYTSGYRIVPRYLSDIGTQGPQILSGPQVIDITPTSARVIWTTAAPSTSTVEFGPTTGYGQEVSDPAMVTDHDVLLDPIDDATYWNYRVASTDAEGTTYSPNANFITPPATDEAVMIYFNKSIDPVYAAAKVAAGNVALDEILISYIDAAQFSVDAAMYSLTLPQVADALIAAHQRGVLVRVIKEFETSNFQFNRLLSAGVPGIDSHFGGNHSSGGVHHNKFWVIDQRDDTSTLDDWLITGSWNPTYQGTEDDAQNVLVIKDTAVAGAYTTEFNEMWGSETQVPDPAQSRMGSAKFNNTEHDFVVNGIQLEVYFAPSDGTEVVMLFWHGQTGDFQTYFSILHFNRTSIETSLRAKWDNIPGYEIRGIFDQNVDGNSRYWNMSGGGDDPWSPPADVHLGDYSPGFLHHKIMLIDPGHAESDPIVITGSPNWSTAATTTNDENQVYIHDYTISRIYLQEFAERYHAAGGTGELGQGSSAVDDTPAPVPAAGLALGNFPNPFNPYTTIRFNLARAAALPSLVIVDAAGRHVRELRLGPLPSGTHEVAWDGTDEAGRQVASGVYYYRVAAAGQSATSRMVLAR